MRENYSAPVARNILFLILFSHRPHWLPVYKFYSEAVRSGRKKTMREHHGAPIARNMLSLPSHPP